MMLSWWGIFQAMQQKELQLLPGIRRQCVCVTSYFHLLYVLLQEVIELKCSIFWLMKILGKKANMSKSAGNKGSYT